MVNLCGERGVLLFLALHFCSEFIHEGAHFSTHHSSGKAGSRTNQTLIFMFSLQRETSQSLAMTPCHLQTILRCKRFGGCRCSTKPPFCNTLTCLVFFIPLPPIGPRNLQMCVGGFPMSARMDQLSHQEGETAMRYGMEAPCSSGSTVKFITASCSHIYRWHITTCNQSQMSVLAHTH